MKYIKLKLRSKFNNEYCNAIERGKCCYKPHFAFGFCQNHHYLFSLFNEDVSKIQPDCEIIIDYDLKPYPMEGICQICEKSKGKDRNFCENPIYKKNLCQKHFQILKLTNSLDFFPPSSEKV